MTAWTVGLFGAGAALARSLSATWTEPIVLLALGLAFLFVSARSGVRPARTVTQLPARTPAAPVQAPARASVRVEQSA
ncbi:MAG TPA: hypothetical protein VFL83_15885 [Anaeromyxobacter sp.]|nr:hypothetical protein [Anaeromyxobacter sp.]